MLDNVTKRRIDTARDILVGKVPDPKSQVEQITIALIYKFMDDMDAQAEEMGGKRSFFSGEYEKYGWAKLMSLDKGGHEVLNLYGEAITTMNQNEGIPPLFRDIFKNAYLPYRDPETLKSFLKIINDFEYDHSERLGDAFEYLLSVLGSQGDAGQFRTPRHIIDFMVEVIDPKKDESILDPACGTAGFLISSWKHVLQANSKDGRKGAGLTPDERKRLTKNIKGYDISPDMVRLSLVNLYLHGFTDPHISEYDTLTSEDNWNEYSDIIMANPPFMSPKGGIKPHKRFSVQAKRSEVLFVDYIAEHLTPNGRAAVIVPEGIIFQSQNAYKQLRQMLVKNYLYAVVSLPAGVFQPYSGVKTSILLMDKTLAKKCDSILFVKIENDGFDLGAQRREIQKNDLPQAKQALQAFHHACAAGEADAFNAEQFANMLKVDKEKIGENGEWNLSGERYRETFQIQTEWDLVELCQIIDYEQPTKYIVDSVNYNYSFDIPVLTAGKSFILGYTDEKEGIFNNLPVIIFDDFTTSTKFVDFPFKVKSSAMKLLHVKKDKAIPIFIFHMMQQINFPVNEHKRYWISQYSKSKIPLPSLKIQQEIVAEIEGYQKIIDGARAVVENYKPQIQIDPEWEMVKLESLLSGEKHSIKAGPFGSSIKKEFYVEKGYKIYGQEQVIKDDLTYGDYYIDEKKYQELKNCRIKTDDILISLVGTIGKITIVPTEFEEGIINPRLIKITLDKEKIIPFFFKYYFQSETILFQIKQNAGGGTMPVLNGRILKELKFPTPPVFKQKEIVAKIEKEQALINTNKELITLFEQKIKDKIASVWGEDVTAKEEVPA